MLDLQRLTTEGSQFVKKSRDYFLTIGYDAAHTQIGERAVAYLIIGAILPLRSLNALKLSILHGKGRHDVVAKLQTSNRLIFLGAIILLIIIRVPPSYLLLAFLCSEIFLAILAVVKHKLRDSWKIWIGFSSVRSTLIQGYRYLFTDDALDTILYIDFLILGFFVSSWELGVYAEAIQGKRIILLPISEGGMNLKTTDINQLINTMGVKALSKRNTQ